MDCIEVLYPECQMVLEVDHSSNHLKKNPTGLVVMEMNTYCGFKGIHTWCVWNSEQKQPRKSALIAAQNEDYNKIKAAKIKWLANPPPFLFLYITFTRLFVSSGITRTMQSLDLTDCYYWIGGAGKKAYIKAAVQSLLIGKQDRLVAYKKSAGSCW